MSFTDEQLQIKQFLIKECGFNVQCYDVAQRLAIIKYVFVASVRNYKQMYAFCDKFTLFLRKANIKLNRKEVTAHWSVFDCADTFVMFFTEKYRHELDIDNFYTTNISENSDVLE